MCVTLYLQESFNPCFGGSYIMTRILMQLERLEVCFNPCFGGSYIMTESKEMRYTEGFRFQSLFWWILYYDIKSNAF